MKRGPYVVDLRKSEEFRRKIGLPSDRLKTYIKRVVAIYLTNTLIFTVNQDCPKRYFT